MKIYKESENSRLFQLHGLTEEQIIAENDIHRNYRSYLEAIVKLPDKQLQQAAPGDPKQVRNTLRLQIDTCLEYEKAFQEVIALSKDELN